MNKMPHVLVLPLSNRVIIGITFFIAAFAICPINVSSQNQEPGNIIAIKHITCEDCIKDPTAVGEKVTEDLPIVIVHAAGGRLVDKNGIVFESFPAQSISYPGYGIPMSNAKIPSRCACEIMMPKNVRWGAVYTTFYVVLASDKGNMRLVRSCGKSPRALGNVSTLADRLKLAPSLDIYPQYLAINASNFINHAQMAQDENGNVNEVIAAGEIDIVAGKIIYIDNNSGHFRPDIGSFLAYLKKLDSSKVLTLTKKLKDIVNRQNKSITEDEKVNLTKMRSMKELGMTENDPRRLIPRRNYRPGTGGGYSYTTVFEVTPGKEARSFILSGGLLSPDQDGIYLFQNDIKVLTGDHVKSISLKTLDFGSEKTKYNVLDVQVGGNTYKPALYFWTEGAGAVQEHTLPKTTLLKVNYFKEYESGEWTNIKKVTISLKTNLSGEL